MSNDEDMTARIHEDEYFSKLYLTQGYWQIHMDEESKKYTAFTTFSSGSYQFWNTSMPFGNVNSDATFIRQMRLSEASVGWKMTISLRYVMQNLYKQNKPASSGLWDTTETLYNAEIYKERIAKQSYF